MAIAPPNEAQLVGIELADLPRVATCALVVCLRLHFGVSGVVALLVSQAGRLKSLVAAHSVDGDPFLRWAAHLLVED